jgi:ACT domain-containing protein
VTDVYRAIDPLIDRESTLEQATTKSDSGSAQRLIVSVFGVDRPGIIAAVTHVLADAQCSIIDINQTVVQKKFAMVLIADMSQSRESAASLKEKFRVEGDRLGVRIYAQREDLFNAMHRV